MARPSFKSRQRSPCSPRGRTFHPKAAFCLPRGHRHCVFPIWVIHRTGMRLPNPYHLCCFGKIGKCPCFRKPEEAHDSHSRRSGASLENEQKLGFASKIREINGFLHGFRLIGYARNLLGGIFFREVFAVPARYLFACQQALGKSGHRIDVRKIRIPSASPCLFESPPIGQKALKRVAELPFKAALLLAYIIVASF